jgi:hypothetical protein
VKRVVIGENKNFMGGEELLLNKGKEVVVLDNAECKEFMTKFMKEKPELWYVMFDNNLLALVEQKLLTTHEVLVLTNDNPLHLVEDTSS